MIHQLHQSVGNDIRIKLATNIPAPDVAYRNTYLEEIKQEKSDSK